MMMSDGDDGPGEEEDRGLATEDKKGLENSFLVSLVFSQMCF